MKKFLLLIPAIILFSSCKKRVEDIEPNVNKNQGYIQIDCENCLVGYGMPDQYQSFNNANGVSVKYPYSYINGYTLRAQLTALDTEQKLSISVYDNKNDLIYKSASMQPTEGFWAVSVLLPSATE
jgi:hypothetical protein